MAIQLEKYKTEGGRCPWRDWLESLSPVVSVRITKSVLRLEQGNFGNCKAVKGVAGVFELAMDFGPGYRAYYGRHGQTVVLLLCGGDKSTQPADMAKAGQYWLDYQRRRSQDETEH